MIADSESVYLIVNPRAGRVERKKKWDHQPSSRSWVWAETSSEGHAESLAYEASLQGFGRIVAVGGDGTIHEVLNGLLRNPDNRSTLGFKPVGTANDYAASFSPKRKGQQESVLRVDVGCLRWEGGARYFANVAGIGFSGEVADQARRMLRMPARMRYTFALLRQLGPGYGPQTIEISLDGGPMQQTETLLISAAIGKREGSYPLHLRADLTDGLFEFLRVGRLSRRELAWYFPGMLRGYLPQDHPQLTQTQCRLMRLTASQPIPIHLDGEFPKGASADALTSLTLEVVPRAIDVVWV
jgi:diacylglycerol kinase (ATP)